MITIFISHFCMCMANGTSYIIYRPQSLSSLTLLAFKPCSLCLKHIVDNANSAYIMSIWILSYLLDAMLYKETQSL